MSAKTPIIAISAAAAMLASSGAWSKDHHCGPGSTEPEESWCRKSARASMTPWEKSMERRVAEIKKEQKASFVNCRAHLENYKTAGVWIGPPSLDDCISFANDAEAKANAALDKADDAMLRALEAK